MDTMYCKNCKTKYTGGESHCQLCGVPLIGKLTFHACALKNGDESAFNELYHSTQSYTRKLVLYYLTTNAIDTNLAEDCMQEVYLRLHQKIGLFDDTKAAFSTWFETLRKNTILNFCEKMKKHQSEISQEESELLQCEDISRMPEHLSDNDEISSIVSEMIDQLPEEQRICIRKFYMEEMKQDQIAKELGIPVGTVKSRLSKGKQKIGEMVLDLQKRGKKIYSFSPVLIFWWFFQDCAEACVGTATATEAASAELLEKNREITKVAAKGAETTTAKAVTVGGMSVAKVISLVAMTGLAVAAAIGIGVSISNSNTQKADKTVEETVVKETETENLSGETQETTETVETVVEDPLFSTKIDVNQYEACGWGNGYTLPVQQNGLWGLVDYEGNVILEPSYEEYYFFPNEEGYAIFRDTGVLHIVGRDGVVHSYQGNIDQIRIGEGNIVTYCTAYNEDTDTISCVYEKLDGTEVYRVDYNFGQDEWSYIYAGMGATFNNGKAYICQTNNGRPTIVELSLDGNHRVLKTNGPVVPISSGSEGYIACRYDNFSWYLMLNTETMEYSDYFESTNTGLFPTFDWQSWHSKNVVNHPFLTEGATISDDMRNSILYPDFSNQFYDEYKLNTYYKNGNEMYNYGKFGCVRINLPDGTMKDVLFDYFNAAKENKISTAIAIYDEILFDDFDYLAVKNGTEWSYIDYEGNVVSKSYKAATSFNDEGYALVLDEDGNAYVINQTFEVVTDAGEASEIGTCGEMFILDNQYVFYYGEKYL